MGENDSHLGGNASHKFFHCVLAANLYDALHGPIS